MTQNYGIYGIFPIRIYIINTMEPPGKHYTLNTKS